MTVLPRDHGPAESWQTISAWPCRTLGEFIIPPRSAPWPAVLLAMPQSARARRFHRNVLGNRGDIDTGSCYDFQITEWLGLAPISHAEQPRALRMHAMITIRVNGTSHQLDVEN